MTLAPEISRNESITPTSLPSSSGTKSISTTSAPTNSQASNTLNPNQSSKMTSNTGAIAGGVVGGLISAVLFVLLGGLVQEKDRYPHERGGYCENHGGVS